MANGAWAQAFRQIPSSWLSCQPLLTGLVLPRMTYLSQHLPGSLALSTWNNLVWTITLSQSIMFSCQSSVSGLGRDTGCSEQCWNEHGVQLALQDPEFSVSRCAPGRGTAASRGSSILNSWRNLRIVFRSSCIMNILSRVHVPFL